MAAKVTEPTHSCEICGLDGLPDEEMREHVLQHVGAAGAGVSCPFCDLTNVSSDEMLIHVNTTHLDYLTPSEEYFAFIDDDDSQGTTVISPTTNGWSDKPTSTSKINNNCNNNEIVAGCSNFRGEGSPLRCQLNLNLISRGSAQPKQQCPMCMYGSNSPEDLEEHINRVHFDPKSPSYQSASNGVTKDDYHCPFCIQKFAIASQLELHVNLEHKDILSPAPKGENIESASVDDWSVQCPVCCRSNFQSNKEMVAHIESHFAHGSTVDTPDSSSDRLFAREMEKRERETRRAREQREFEMLRAQYGMDNQGNFKEQSIANMQKAVYAGEMTVAEFYERKVGLRAAENSGVDDGSSCTNGLLPKIRCVSSQASSVVRTLLCTTVDHYASTYGDKGWGCGYRNVQMLISSLLHHTGYNEQLYKPAVVGGGLLGADCTADAVRSAVPSISRLQQHIEWAWRQGFDVQGAEQLDGKLHNTRKWIGATEVVTALSSLRIRCQLLDFHQPTGVEGSHPQLFNWVLQYFQKQQDFTPPLYLQHQGHSRTVAGIEVHKDGHLTLLVFDPSHSPEQMGQFKCTAGGTAGMRLIRKTINAMKARQYQLVAVNGIMATEREYQESKVLRSIRVPADR